MVRQEREAMSAIYTLAGSGSGSGVEADAFAKVPTVQPSKNSCRNRLRSAWPCSILLLFDACVTTGGWKTAREMAATCRAKQLDFHLLARSGLGPPALVTLSGRFFTSHRIGHAPYHRLMLASRKGNTGGITPSRLQDVLLGHYGFKQRQAYEQPGDTRVRLPRKGVPKARQNCMSQRPVARDSCKSSPTTYLWGACCEPTTRYARLLRAHWGGNGAA